MKIKFTIFEPLKVQQIEINMNLPWWCQRDGQWQQWQRRRASLPRTPCNRNYPPSASPSLSFLSLVLLFLLSGLLSWCPYTYFVSLTLSEILVKHLRRLDQSREAAKSESSGQDRPIQILIGFLRPAYVFRKGLKSDLLSPSLCLLAW